MRRIQHSLQAITAAIMLVSLLVALPGSVSADVAGNPSLIISQLKVTSGGQFITLYNATDSALDMAKYQLEYFNSYDLDKAYSSKLISLSGTVPPHGYFMVNDDSLLLCYRMTVDSVSLGLSTTAGMIELLALKQTSPGSPAVSVLQDYVGWSKAVAPGAQTLPANGAFLQRRPTDPSNNPYITAPGAGSWLSVQPDSINPCSLVSTGSGSIEVPTALSQLLPSGEPPSVILETDSPGTASAAKPAIPAADIGLKAPTLTEVLPNPLGTGNDSNDEFVELYNPNSVPFDLTGFSLQTGTTSLHTFTFPAGSSLPPQGFKAFYSSLTGLSLSNSSGQAKLLDPFGNSISITAVYGTAGDGQTWSLAKGKWYWTATATPGKANIIKQLPKKTSAKVTSHKKKNGAISTTKLQTAQTAAQSESGAASTSPIHVRTLAVVVVLALLYAAYEYRTDLANYIHRLRRYFGARYEDRA